MILEEENWVGGHKDYAILQGSIWSVYPLAFIQYTWQYLVCISQGIYSAYMEVFGLHI